MVTTSEFAVIAKLRGPIIGDAGLLEAQPKIGK